MVKGKLLFVPGLYEMLSWSKQKQMDGKYKFDSEPHLMQSLGSF
jgi:hypothetical protein